MDGALEPRECQECGRMVVGLGQCLHCILEAQETAKQARLTADKPCECCGTPKSVLHLVKVKMKNCSRFKSYALCSNCRKVHTVNMTLEDIKAALIVTKHKEDRKSMGRLSKEEQAIASGRVALLAIPVHELSTFSFMVAFVAGAPYFSNGNRAIDLRTKVCMIKRDEDGAPILYPNGEVENEWVDVTFRCRERTVLSYLDTIPTNRVGGNEVPAYIGKPVALLFEKTRPAKDGRVWWDATPFFLDKQEDYVKCPSNHATPLTSLLIKDNEFLSNCEEFKKRNGYDPLAILTKEGHAVSVAVSGGYGIEKAVESWQSFINGGQESGELPSFKKSDDIPFG